MPPRRPVVLALLAVVAAAGPAVAQTVDLTDAVRPGDCVRYDLALAVDGKMTVDRDGKAEAVPLKARAAHRFVERADAVDGRGGGRAVRWYQTATSEAETGFDRSKRDLAADRRLIAVRRTPAGPLPFSPAGPLTRDDLDLVAEHFDTLALPALLPGRATVVGDSWAVPADAVRAACQFDALIKGGLTGKLVGVADGVAGFTVAGTAEGVEAGAHATVTVSAAGTFDVAAKRVTELRWEQTDDRDQGPASPAAAVKATLSLTRAVLAAEPAELGPAARAAVPAGEGVPDALLRLRYDDGDGRYRFTYPRAWRIVGRTRDHLVLRLVDGGEFTAQATLTAWKAAAPGRHATADEFKAAVARMPGWEPAAVLADEAVPAGGDGRWLYRVAARGKQDGVPVVQVFYLLAGPGGDQLAVTVVARAEAAARLAARDLALVQAVEFPGRK